MMKKRTRMIALTLATVFCVTLLAGCQSSGGSSAPAASKPAASTPAQPSQPSTPAVEPVEITFSHNFPEDHVVGVGVAKASEWIKEKSGGAITFKVYSAGTYANVNDALQAVAIGSLDVAQIDTAMEWSTFAGVTLAPYLFHDFDHWTKFKASDVYPEFKDAVTDAVPFRLMSLCTFGFRYVTANKIYDTPEAFEGVKMRMPLQAPYPEMATVLNCVGTPMDAGEVYMALSTNVMDGQENTYSDIISRKFYEVQDYIIKTGHVMSSCGFAMSDKCWDKLNDEQRALVSEALEYACQVTDELTIANDAEYEQFMRDQGLEVIEIDKQPFMDRVPLVMEKYPEFKEFYDKIQQLA